VAVDHRRRLRNRVRDHQAYITVFVSTEEGTQGQAMFLASFFTGSLSGAAIGGFWSTDSGSR